METQPIASSARALRHMFLRDLVLAASIGVHPHEHTAQQRVRINVDLGVEDDGARALSRQPVGRDELARVVDYEKLAERVRGIVAAGHVRLVETLAERIAEACLADRQGSPRACAGGKAGHLRGCGIGGRANRTASTRISPRPDAPLRKHWSDAGLC